MDIKYIKVGKWYNVPFKVVEIKSGDIHMENGGIKAVCQPSDLSEITTRQDVRAEHSTVGTICEGADHLPWKYRPLLFSDDDLKYAADYFKAMQNHIKSTLPDAENGIKNTETAPKYDPCRLFRKRDKVRIKREINGRLLHHSFVNFKYDTVYTVDADEVQKSCKSGHVVITDGKHYCSLPFYELELVTPVEELEPYYTLQDCEEIDGDTVVFWAVRDEHDDTVAKFYVELYRADGAQKAAEAERDRRNAEHRKEQSNG